MKIRNLLDVRDLRPVNCIYSCSFIVYIIHVKFRPPYISVLEIAQINKKDQTLVYTLKNLTLINQFKGRILKTIKYIIIYIINSKLFELIFYNIGLKRSIISV